MYEYFIVFRCEDYTVDACYVCTNEKYDECIPFEIAKQLIKDTYNKDANKILGCYFARKLNPVKKKKEKFNEIIDGTESD